MALNMKRIALFIFLSLWCPYLFAQEYAPFEGLEIDRVVIKNGSGFSFQWDWDNSEASKWGLTERHRKIPYDNGNGKIRYLDHNWWGWQNETIVNETLSDGSRKTSSNNPYISVSWNLHPEWLILCIKNNTSFYLVVDLGSIYGFASPPEPNLSDRRYEVGESSLALVNSLGDVYHTLLLPPHVESSASFYNKMWKIGHVVNKNGQYTLSGENRSIFMDVIENNARVDLSFQIGIFRSDPLLRNKSLMQQRSKFTYRMDTPTEVMQGYRGPYFQEGLAYYINEDYASLFSDADMRIEELLICKYKKSSSRIKTSLNGFGFRVFDDSVSTTRSSHASPSEDNSMIRPQDEPANHLGMSVSEVRKVSPGLRYSSTRNGMEEYEYDGISYSFKDGKLVCEYTTIDGGQGFGRRVYNSFVSKFKETNYSRIGEANPGIIFYYSTFSVSFTYWASDDSVSITYQSYDYWK